MNMDIKLRLTVCQIVNMNKVKKDSLIIKTILLQLLAKHFYKQKQQNK